MTNYAIKAVHAAVPGWAKKVTLSVLESAGHSRVLPPIIWKYCDRVSSSGMTYLHSGKIIVRQGTDATDALLILLHELAHYLLREGHTTRFWILAFELFKMYGIPREYAEKRSLAYRKGAVDGITHMRGKYGDY